MKTLIKLTLILLVISQTILVGIAGDASLSWGSATVGSAETTAVIPVNLDIDHDLSFVSITLGITDQVVENERDITLNPTRFPFGDRAVTVSVSPDKKEITLTAADLLGQNAMVKAGVGTLFTINVHHVDTTRSALTVKAVEAFDVNAQKVAIAVK